jgi:hypothetical protein
MFITDIELPMYPISSLSGQIPSVMGQPPISPSKPKPRNSGDTVQFSGRKKEPRPLLEPWRTIGHHGLYAISPDYRSRADLNSFLPPEVRKRGKVKISFNTLATGLTCAIAMFDQSAVVSPAEIFFKYAFVDTSSTHVNIQELDMDGIEHSPGFPDLQKRADKMKQRGEEHQEIQIPFVYRMGGADRFSVGDMNAELTGELVCKEGQWELVNGRVTISPNFADYDPAEHREFLGEALTRAVYYGIPWGDGHWILFDGAKNVSLSGKC